MANIKEVALQQAEKIYETLSRQSFADWYGIVDETDNSDFSEHLMGVTDSKTYDEIIADIIRIFHLPL